jgi:SET domain-containing protein
MTKNALLSQLQNNFYVALQPSAVHGIGVFAIRDIPQGCRDMFAPEEGEWIALSFEEVEALPEHSRNFIETYFLYDDKQYFLPAHGCKLMDVASYLNHSGTPNIISVNDGACFEAIRGIKKGEELFVDYGTIVEEVEEY